MKLKHTLKLMGWIGTSFLSHADTFTLKDGSILQGRVIREVSDSYFLEIDVTKSIKDERVISKSEVVKITRDAPDLKAFESLAAFVPTPDSLTLDIYASQIAELEKFIKNYPSSAKLEDAKKILDTLNTEMVLIRAGGVKLNGGVIEVATYQANAYDFDAQVQESKIQKLAANRQFLPALRLFAEFERDYRNTESYPKLLPLIKQIIEIHVNEAKQSLSTLEERLKERALGLSRMVLDRRNATEKAIKSDDIVIANRYKAEKDAKFTWFTTSPFHKESLVDTVKFGQSELSRLNTVKIIPELDGGKAYREFFLACQSDVQPTAFSAAFAKVKAAAIPIRYITPLEAAVKKLK